MAGNLMPNMSRKASLALMVVLYFIVVFDLGLFVIPQATIDFAQSWMLRR